MSHRLGALGASWILLWVFIALVGSPIRPDSSEHANAQHLEHGLLPPGAVWEDASGETHTAWLGTDQFGRTC